MNIRDANESDLDFIAWAQLCASRSHVRRGIWEYINDQDEAQTLAFLKRIASTDVPHWCHWSLFQVAEVDGTPAAAMCGFDPATQGMGPLGHVIPAVLTESEVVLDQDYMRRVGTVGMCTSEFADGAWVIENVATRPEFRRRGLVDALITATLDRGRSLGFNLGQISVFIGNEPAKRAYEKAGFEVKDDKRDPTFEAELGFPGMERMLQAL
jgi:ribosomal protein S18 acetylase RimI-like enzyme